MSAGSASSSVYSRSTDSVKIHGPPVHRRTGSNVPPEPDCPHITAADHHIGDARGFSTALESTASRLQIAKKDRPSTDHEWQISLLDELTGIRWENEFYGACSDLYDELVLAVTQASRELLSQSQSYLRDYLSEQDSGTVNRGFLLQGARKLNTALQNSQACQAAALQSWIDKWEQAPGARKSVRWL
ncbi:uncharacterized protein N7498_007858 [Penicillium cinerascens]|uniref:Uncharacterized protein n=1 Tax=Penicillium cinerascens TaxID=70096 RepID=A0A9W9JMF4_9EURO|nr:uncharacterized protein N7498_007858 [Penicillium cinerascens]KAJ5198741.1 hypothetical protein N7498_007858 [Penicillium cinerascens]